MASNTSNYLKNAILNWIKGTSFPAAPAAVYIEIFDGALDDAGAGANSLQSTITGSANRTAVTFGAILGNQTIINDSIAIITGSAVGNATIGGFGIYDAQTGGNLLYHGTDSAAVTIGDRVTFEIGDLLINIS